MALVMSVTMLFSVSSCSKKDPDGGHITKNPAESKPEYRETFPTDPTDVYITPVPGPSDDNIVDFLMFSTYNGTEKSSDNEIKQLIAEKTGVRVDEYWLTGQTPDEAVGAIIASGDLPDFIDAGDLNIQMYQNGLLVAWDDYLERYPNLKALYTDEEWEMFRMPDGHIYWANVSERYNGKDTSTTHTGQAFWIQARVLEWDNYPKIETLDEYFDLLERYAAANPTNPNGEPVIPYTCLCEDWRYFSIEAAPMYLDGYANDGCVIVNNDDGDDNIRVIDYNTTDTARDYFRKLNEEYNKGIIDPDFAVQTYDEYIEKLASGRVLGMCDQYWDFAYSIRIDFDHERTSSDGKSYTNAMIGCDYVPIGLVAEKGMEQRYHTYGAEQINTASGIAVTTGCFDPDRAFMFLNDLLDQEIMNLRFWGIEGVDYLIDENGLFYRTQEMNDNWKSEGYKQYHTCEYSYMPQWRGMSSDGINRMMPSEQPSIFKETLPKELIKCFDAYGAGNYVEMLGSVYCDSEKWYPLWSWSNGLDANSTAGAAWQRMSQCKHEWLPKIVLAKDFDSVWDSYMSAYEDCDPDEFLDEALAEVNRRIANN